MTVRIAVLNQKGGVGKTTTAVNLAAELARLGHRTLLVDFDPSRNATQFLGLGDDSSHAGASEFVLSGRFEPIRNVLLPKLSVICATHDHALLERRLLENVLSGTRRLQRALDAVVADFDYVITDCGPNLGMLAYNAVVACPSVLVPVELAHAAAMGAALMRAWLEDARIDLQPRIRILGVLGTFADDRERTPREIRAVLHSIFGPELFNTTIHTSAAIRDAAGKGRPVVLESPSSRGALEYQALTQEVVRRGNA